MTRLRSTLLLLVAQHAASVSLTGGRPIINPVLGINTELPPTKPSSKAAGRKQPVAGGTKNPWLFPPGAARATPTSKRVTIRTSGKSSRSRSGTSILTKSRKQQEYQTQLLSTLTSGPLAFNIVAFNIVAARFHDQGKGQHSAAADAAEEVRSRVGKGGL